MKSGFRFGKLHKWPSHYLKILFILKLIAEILRKITPNLRVSRTFRINLSGLGKHSGQIPKQHWPHNGQKCSSYHLTGSAVPTVINAIRVQQEQIYFYETGNYLKLWIIGCKVCKCFFCREEGERSKFS